MTNVSLYYANVLSTYKAVLPVGRWGPTRRAGELRPRVDVPPTARREHLNGDAYNAGWGRGSEPDREVPEPGVGA